VRKLVLALLLGGLALALLGMAASAAADTGPTPLGSYTDPRFDLPSRPGSIVKVDYGPFTVPANGEVHNQFDATAPAPCTNCRITDIVPTLVYASGSPDGSTAGSTANLSNNAMMHHIVLINNGATDLGCPSGLQGAIGERLFAAGNERTHLHLPTPFGYENGNAPTWTLIYHLVNKGPVDKKVNVEIVYRYRPLSETQAARPVWLDIDGCSDSEYTIPTGYSDFHDPDNVPDGSGNYSADWPSTISGRIIAISGHSHDVDITNTARCNNATDDDADGAVNDGCPAYGTAETQCADAIDNDGDGKVNDGCPAVGLPEGPCPTHCATKGGGIAVSAELRGGPSNDYFGPSQTNNPTPPDLTGATLCRSEANYGTVFDGSTFDGLQWSGHLDTMSTCGIFTDVPSGAEPQAYPPGGAYPSSGYPLRQNQVIRLHSEYQNNTGDTLFDVMGIMVMWVATPTSYPTPVGASPMRVSLVPAYKPCETAGANSTHGPPLNFPSCSTPQLNSTTTVMDSSAIGFARMVVCDAASTSAFCNPTGNVLTKPDLRFTGSIRDVKCRTSSPPGCSAGADYNPHSGAGPYTDAGNGTVGATPPCFPGASSTTACIANTDVTMTASLPGASVGGTGAFQGNGVRITDQNNGATPSGTVVNIGFPVPMDCISTATALGSSCGVNTTANALAPGTVNNGDAAVWELGEVQIKDSGPDGVRGNSDDQVFASQGILLP
jgi:hypothetical protein